MFVVSVCFAISLRPRFEKAVGIDTRSRVVGATFDQELQAENAVR